MTVAVVVLGILLSCNQGNFTCAGDRVSCRCDEAVLSLVWRVYSTDTVFSASFSDQTLNETSNGVGIAVDHPICKWDLSDITDYCSVSKLNFVLMETVNVVCDDNWERSNALLQRARRFNKGRKWRCNIFGVPGSENMLQSTACISLQTHTMKHDHSYLFCLYYQPSAAFPS